MANSLRLQLIETLKDLPKDFEWNYFTPRHCALGVYRAYVQDTCIHQGWPEIGERLGLDELQTFDVFFAAGKCLGKPLPDVTPQDVATILESF